MLFIQASSTFLETLQKPRQKTEPRQKAHRQTQTSKQLTQNVPMSTPAQTPQLTQQVQLAQIPQPPHAVLPRHRLPPALVLSSPSLLFSSTAYPPPLPPLPPRYRSCSEFDESVLVAGCSKASQELNKVRTESVSISGICYILCRSYLLHSLRRSDLNLLLSKKALPFFFDLLLHECEI